MSMDLAVQKVCVSIWYLLFAIIGLMQLQLLKASLNVLQCNVIFGFVKALFLFFCFNFALRFDPSTDRHEETRRSQLATVQVYTMHSLF